MLKTNREKRICAKYGTRDETGHVHCTECPLNLAGMHPSRYGWRDLMCKATAHYDRHLREWVLDEEGE